jgi:hypothetical protein
MSSLPSLRSQVKDAVTASTKQWLLEIRNVSAKIGKLAIDAMETRTRRWRVRREKEQILRLSRVGSAVELVNNEKTDCEFFHKSIALTLVYHGPHFQTTCCITIKWTLTSSHCTNAFIHI